jgi:hypothetical protein
MSGESEVIHRGDQDVTDYIFRWYGWASPIGLGLFLVALGVVAVLVRFAILGR